MITLDLKDAYQRLFWEETNSQILAFEQDVLEVEGGVYTQETIERMFRTAHSMKGSSATIGAVEIMRVSHLLEDLLNVLKTNSAAFDVLSEVKEATHQLEASVDMYLLIIGVGEKRFGLSVGRILGEQEVVIKSLKPYIGEKKYSAHWTKY